MDLQHEGPVWLVSSCRVYEIANIKNKKPYKITNEEKNMKKDISSCLKNDLIYCT
jgi:hypothetical protein